VSWQACDWADSLPYDSCKPIPFRVLVKLANVAAQDGTRAWRNKHEVAAELGVHVKSVQTALRELEAGHLIFKGDQRAVEHIPGNRRPTVYDLNFGYSREFAQPEIPFDVDPESHTKVEGAELSTGAPGGVSGGVFVAPLRTKRTTYQDIDIETHVPERATRASEREAALRQCGSRRRGHQWHGRYCAVCEIREDGVMPNANGEYSA
jgi:hypothetical protein